MMALGAGTAQQATQDVAVQILESSVSSRSEIRKRRQQYEPYARAAGDVVPILAEGDLGAVQDWSERALTEYVQNETGLNLRDGNVQRQLQAIAAGMGEELLEEEFGIDLSLEARNLPDAMRNIAYCACRHATGIDPELAEVSIEALSDGKLTTSECEAIAGTAGAIAGAAVCQAFGIPAPIGAWLGGTFGKSIGRMIGDITGMTARERWEAEEEARLAALQAMYDYGQEHCKKTRARYWVSFDESLARLHQQWQQLECIVGARFDLRYFQVAPPGGPGLTNVTGRRQCDRPLGCLYGRRSDMSAGPYEREAQAFYRWGLVWPRCIERRICEMPKPGPNERVRNYRQLVRSFTGGNEWPIRAGGALRGPWDPGYEPYQARFDVLNAAVVRITGDLTATAAAVAAELDITRQKEQLKRSGLSSRDRYVAAMLASAAAAGARVDRRNSKIAGYGMLALGGGLLGYTLYRQRRQS